MKRLIILLLIAVFANTIMAKANSDTLVYWQDVVITQPDTYHVNRATNTIDISTAEDLVWWSNNINSGDIVRLMADIDLANYLWNPIDNAWYIEINGNGHRIKNMQINANGYGGMFGDSFFCVFKDIVFENANVVGNLRVGVVAAHTHLDTFVNVGIEGGCITGGTICGAISGESNTSVFTNCYSKNVTVGGDAESALFVSNGDGDIRNCYAHGQITNPEGGSGIMKFKLGGDIRRCYSVSTQWGVVGYNGGGTCVDTSTFYNNNGTWRLRTPITFDNTQCYLLLEALNNDVVEMNNSDLCVWVLDDNTGLPVFGPKYNNPCENVTNLAAECFMSNSTYYLHVTWNDYSAEQWQIKVVENNQTTIVYQNTVNQQYDMIYGLELGKVYDVYVRPVCIYGSIGWGEPVSVLYDKPLWTSVVTSQPNGYTVDNNGNVTITTPEGLAWMAKRVNVYNYDFSGKTITLDNDIDLSLYRWDPCGNSLEGNCFRGTLDGNEHVISNIYVNVSERRSVGLIGRAENAVVKNINLDGGSVEGVFYVGGLLGHAVENCIVENCHSSVEAYSIEQGVGSLCGVFDYSSMKNCSSTGVVCGSASVGGLVGSMYGSDVVNSYATGNVLIDLSSSYPKMYCGGLVGYFAFSSATNCYSSGLVEMYAGYTGIVIGCPDYDTHIHFVYGNNGNNTGLELTGSYCNDMTNSSKFQHNGTSNLLLTPILINGVTYTELLNVLNAWVTYRNDHTIRTWTMDSNSGYPRLGDYFEPSCYNPMNLVVTNATVIGETTIQTELSWNQIGDPDHWEVLYVASEQDISGGVVVPVYSNPCVLTNIPVGIPLDFYVRAVCDDDNTSNWSYPVSYIPDKLRWTEVVTTQPEGYYTDNYGNVYITNAEGLAWLSSVVNGLNNVQYNPNCFQNKTIEIMSDIDLSEYRWTPIGKEPAYCLKGATFKGNGFTINGLYCNELEDFQGLIGFMIDGTVRDVVTKNSVVNGQNYVGGIVGYASSVAEIDLVNFSLNSVDIINCEAHGVIRGIMYIGGLLGRHLGSDNIVANSSFRGSIISRDDITKASSVRGYMGGLCGAITHDSFMNCYVAIDEISEDAFLSGILIGTGVFPNSVSNCYYKYDGYSLGVADDYVTVVNCTSFSGSGHSWTLDEPQNINGSYYNDLVLALNAWVNANNTQNTYRSWAVDAGMANGGFPLLISNGSTSYVVATAVNPTNSGYITGTGTFNNGEMATISIHHNNSFMFVGWTENGDVVSTDETYSFVVTENRFLVANLILVDGIVDDKNCDFTIYPNPADDIIFIESETELKHCEIYNATGYLVYKHDSIEKNMTISVSNLPAGNYIIRLSSGDKMVSKMFIKK